MSLTYNIKYYIQKNFEPDNLGLNWGITNNYTYIINITIYNNKGWTRN